MQLHNIINEATQKLPKTAFQHLMTPAIRALDNASRDAGFEIRIVGGAVRDLVQGIDPKDIDIATTALPEQMMQVLDQAGIRHAPTGLEHGTITAVLDGEPIEITTLRIDINPDGRHTDVEFTTDWRKDAERRDLTFNAMSMEMDGTLHDFFGGIDDLQNGVAKFVGDADNRMQEDFLRILRFFRFQGRLQTPHWDNDTMESVTRNASGLAGVSGERIWSEMGKILSQPSRVTVLKQMERTGVLAAINMPSNRIGMLNQVDSNDPVVALAATINTVGTLHSLRQEWKFTNTEFATANFIISNRHNPIDETEVKRMLTNPKIKNDHVVAMLGSIGKGELARSVSTWTPPEFPVNGSDLIAIGMPTGVAMGKKLAELRDQWEQSGFNLTKEQLMNGVK
jgi:tRNA nucleotidyltransferase (CCA-adding enzyme)